jgi:hypothetical protein
MTTTRALLAEAGVKPNGGTGEPGNG